MRERGKPYKSTGTESCGNTEEELRKFAQTPANLSSTVPPKRFC
jgi:hypothetical protein